MPFNNSAIISFSLFMPVCYHVPWSIYLSLPFIPAYLLFLINTNTTISLTKLFKFSRQIFKKINIKIKFYLVYKIVKVNCLCGFFRCIIEQSLLEDNHVYILSLLANTQWKKLYLNAQNQSQVAYLKISSLISYNVNKINTIKVVLEIYSLELIFIRFSFNY